MKLLYIGNGLTHYYNLVLSRLNNIPDIDLVVVAPTVAGPSIGDGVYQTRVGINFKVVELREKRKFKLYSTFEGLAPILKQECPDVVIVIENYLSAFLFDRSVVAVMKSIGAGIVLKSIPFPYIPYELAKQRIVENGPGFSSLPAFVNALLGKLRLDKPIRRIMLSINKRALNLPDAYVNYIEAYDYWDSYGVPRERIFVTRNSPDTDMIFATRENLTREQSILPANPYRLLHVGRLVEWKRVDMLLHAFARVKKHFPESELLIIGTGPEEEKLKSLAAELQLGNSVSFLGGVYEQERLGRYFLASSLYVLAGMGGLSINEAMGYGLPILCSVCDGTEKVLVREGVNGRYFNEGDEDDLVDKINWFFENSTRLQQMGECSEEIIRTEVNIHTVINGYVEALEYVVQQKAT